MNNPTHIIPSLPGASYSLLRSRAQAFLVLAAILPLLLSTASSSFAGSATWKASPATGDWNTASNWSPATVPNSSADTATFATSNKTAVSLSADTSVNGIVFNAGASAFTITGGLLLIGGGGITNDSGIMQNFVVVRGTLDFFSTTAGSLTNFTNDGGMVSGASGGCTQFIDTSTAGSGTFTNNGGAVSGAGGGVTRFINSSRSPQSRISTSAKVNTNTSSTADHATFTNNGGAVSGAFGGSTLFLNGSTAGSGTFTNNGSAFSSASSGRTLFSQTSTAGNGTLIANGGAGGGGGGLIQFERGSKGGTARVEVFGNGNLDISGHFTRVTTGSIEGDGAVFLGANKLTVGTNNLSTAFSGTMQDGGQAGGTGGSLTKTGQGKLTLSKASTYTGGTTVSKGTLLVKNKTGSATGTGAVQVNGGKLGGTGTIAGAVTVGTGSGTGAFLSPGNSATKPGTLTIHKTVTFNSDSTYSLGLNSSRASADKVVAQGVTINSGGQVFFFDSQPSALTPGTVFTVINNISATPIAGTFSNLADGSTFSSNGNTYQADYQGGDGNDLTLTVQ